MLHDVFGLVDAFVDTWRRELPMHALRREMLDVRHRPVRRERVLAYDVYLAVSGQHPRLERRGRGVHVVRVLRQLRAQPDQIGGATHGHGNAGEAMIGARHIEDQLIEYPHFAWQRERRVERWHLEAEWSTPHLR